MLDRRGEAEELYTRCQSHESARHSCSLSLLIVPLPPSDKTLGAISLGSFLSSPQKTKIGNDIRLVYTDGSFCINKKTRIQTILTLKCKPGRLTKERRGHQDIFIFNLFDVCFSLIDV